MIVLGISCHYHDSAAAILVDGHLVAAAEEERFSRKKHDNSFPVNAITYCLEEAHVQLEDIDCVGYYENPILKAARSLNVLVKTLPSGFKIAPSVISGIRKQFGLRREISSRLQISPDKIHFVEHHLSHAASAYFCSPFKDAAIVTIDGVGEWATATIGVGKDSEISIRKELRFPHSIGLLYSAFTQFLGFQVNEGEYRLMGLAPYGVAKYLDKIDKVVSVDHRGNVRLNMEYFSFLTSRRYTYSRKFVELFGPPNQVIDGEIDQYYADIAASIQAKTEEIVLAMVREAKIQSGSRNLCFAGGVALNSVANGRVSREGEFEDIFIQPAAGDSGGALGAALFVEHQILGHARRFVMDHPYWGREYSDSNIAKILESADVDYETAPTEDALAVRAAELIDSGMVIGWFQGRFEWGPRALGARSILADPRKAEMKDIINAKVKFREAFRPFAPAVLEDRVEEYFEFRPERERYPSRFMLTVHPFKNGKGEEVAAVNHAGTGRLQSVGPEHNPRYHRLISEFFKITGIPIVLNTSFNVRGEPVVCSPEDALATFKKSGIDALVIGSHFVFKKEGAGNYRHNSYIGRRKPWKASLYNLAPQMEDYDRQTLHPIPYLGFIQTPDFRSTSVNTDKSGFRYSNDNNGVLTSENWRQRSRRWILCGGSAAYGVGSTSDAHTIASDLGRKVDSSILNLGIRAGNSTQELISAIPFIEDADNIIVYTGNNTLLSCLQSVGYFDLFCPMFHEETLAQISIRPLRDYRKLFRSRNALEQQDTEFLSMMRAKEPLTTQDAMRSALGIQCRDIRMLRRMCGDDRRLVVVVQPFALSAKPQLCPEEQQIFSLLFESKKESYSLLKHKMAEIWPDYVRMLMDRCRKDGIHVIDANIFDYQGWCFVDPVHMTDHGYSTVSDELARLLI